MKKLLEVLQEQGFILPSLTRLAVFHALSL